MQLKKAEFENFTAQLLESGYTNSNYNTFSKVEPEYKIDVLYFNAGELVILHYQANIFGVVDNLLVSETSSQTPLEFENKVQSIRKLYENTQQN